MPYWQGKRSVSVVTAYMRPDGIPDFTLNEVEVTHEEHANGVHYDLVETLLGQAGYEEPLIHFDQFEAPPFLLPAVRKQLETLQVA
jgi:hypothetical protein